MEVYLDNSATTRPTRPVVEAMVTCMQEGYHNPSSLYKPALDVQKRMDACRKRLGENHVVTFTASGTEADNLAILGHARLIKKPGRVLYTAVEHPAVKQACLALKQFGHEAQAIPVTKTGIVDLAALEQMLACDVIMICVMQVNNETGAIQPMSEISALRDRLAPDAAIHVDGVQGYLRVKMDMDKLGIQSYAISGHKIHAPKGIGALVMQKSFRIQPIIYGGGQENGLRSGTENTVGIIGLDAAIASYPKDASESMMVLKKLLCDLILEAIPCAQINGPAPDSPYCAPHILNMSLPPVRSDTMLFALEGSGIYVSSGSACSSSKQKVSETLLAMGVKRSDAECALRFSLSCDTTEDEIRYTAQEIKRHYMLLSKYTRR